MTFLIPTGKYKFPYLAWLYKDTIAVFQEWEIGDLDPDNKYVDYSLYMDTQKSWRDAWVENHKGGGI